jgi:hypothetical protein
MKLRNVVSVGLCCVLTSPVLAQVPGVACQANATVQANSQLGESGNAVRSSSANVDASNRPSNVQTQLQAGGTNAQLPGVAGQANATVQVNSQLDRNSNADRSSSANVEASNRSSDVQAQLQAGSTNAQLNTLNNANVQAQGSTMNPSFNFNSTVVGGRNINSSPSGNINSGGSILGNPAQFQGGYSNSQGTNMTGNVASGMSYYPNSTYNNYLTSSVQHASGTSSSLSSYPVTSGYVVNSGWSSTIPTSDVVCCCPTKRVVRRSWRLR